MPPRTSKTSVDPVIIMILGVVLVAISITMIVFQSNSSTVSIVNSAGTMSQLVVAFITGITTGGLSCLAVQGGLLASSLAHQIEQDYIQHAAQNKKQRGKKNKPKPRSNSA